MKAGAIGTPATAIRMPIDATESASATGAIASGITASTISRRRSTGPVKRWRPYQSPPTIEPTPHSASSRPAVAREPWSSANAGVATSSAPKAMPAGRSATISVRRPGEASAPSRPAVERPPRWAREAREVANRSVPLTVSTTAVTRATSGEASAAMAPASSGPAM